MVYIERAGAADLMIIHVCICCCFYRSLVKYVSCRKPYFQVRITTKMHMKRLWAKCFSVNGQSAKI